MNKEKITLKDRLLLFLKGLGMGSADVVPGVSGGTVAFITGIYPELLSSIKAVDAKAFKLLLSFKIKAFIEKINGVFLITLLLGIFTAVVSMAKLMTYLLREHPVQLWSFFFGLIVISALWVGREIKQWTGKVVLFAAIGTAISYYITIASPAQTPDSLWFVFVSGAVAICAMILPGISGSFILLIMGKYEYVLGAVKSFDLPVILVFMLGCVVGLLSFVRIVSWLLHRYHDATVALLAGFMVGSLGKIWPWKQVLSYRTNSKGEEVPFLDQNVWPKVYEQTSGQPAYVLQAFLFFVLGIALVWGLEYASQKLKKSV